MEFKAFGYYKRTCQLELRKNGDCVFGKGMVAKENGAWRVEVCAYAGTYHHRCGGGLPLCTCVQQQQRNDMFLLSDLLYDYHKPIFFITQTPTYLTTTQPTVVSPT